MASMFALAIVLFVGDLPGWTAVLNAATLAVL